MAKSDGFIALKRYERGSHPWGLYSARQDRWLDAVFAERRDAEAAEAVLAGKVPQA